MTQKITKCVIPVAGMGTRFLPATKAMPKEMLPIIDKPVIQFLAEEAAASGITDITFVTGRSKRAIEDHFDAAPELEAALAAGNKEKSLKLVQDISKIARFSYVRQNSPKGDGDAILHAAHLVEGDEAIGVMLGDGIVEGDDPALKQLIVVYEKYGETVIGLAEVPMEEVSGYGVVAGEKIAENIFKITDFIEKPSIEKAPSNMIVAGKYVITQHVLQELKALSQKGVSGELRLADALRESVKKRPVYGVMMKGKFYDCGSKLGYLEATVDFALKHPEINGDFKEYLQGVAKNL